MEIRMRTWLLVAIGVAVLCAPAQGHHSFAEYYLEGDTIEVEGEVLEFQYKNPHSWIHVMAQETFGGRKPYAAEWASVSRLEREGITAKTLRPGRRRAHLGQPESQPQRQPYPAQAHRAAFGSLDLGTAARREPLSQIARLDGIGV
jgi:Family of unknown function (DUF6152)